jgi:ankyrin repeat protein
LCDFFFPKRTHTNIFPLPVKIWYIADGGIEMRKIIFIFCVIVIACCWSLYALPTQAQESDAQKLLLDSVKYDKLDVSGVKAALDKGANPNWVSGTGRGSLSVIGNLAFSALGAHREVGAEEKGTEILEMLFKAGAKLQPGDYTSFFYPICYGWALFTEVLLKSGFNPNMEIARRTAMEIAVMYGRTNIIELLKKHGVPALEQREAAQQALIGAAGHHDIPRMEEAIRNGARVNEKNRQGETALVEALHIALSDPEDYLAIMYLLEKGADPTIQGMDYPDKTTALHLAVFTTSFGGRKDLFPYDRMIIESLLRHGALVSAWDSNGMTPLHIAAKWNNIVGAKMLIEAGCKIMLRDRYGKTPLDCAESGEMIKLLKDHGAKEE